MVMVASLTVFLLIVMCVCSWLFWAWKFCDWLCKKKNLCGLHYFFCNYRKVKQWLSLCQLWNINAILTVGCWELHMHAPSIMVILEKFLTEFFSLYFPFHHRGNKTAAAAVCVFKQPTQLCEHFSWWKREIIRVNEETTLNMKREEWSVCVWAINSFYLAMLLLMIMMMIMMEASDRDRERERKKLPICTFYYHQLFACKQQ